MADLRFLQDNVKSNTPVDNEEIIAIYERFRLDDATLHKLSDIAQGIASEMFHPSNSWVREAARDWPGLDTEQRQTLLHKLMDLMKNRIGIDVNLEFADEQEMQVVTWRGVYRSGDNAIVLNIKDDYAKSFMRIAETMVHELIHADIWQKNKHVSLDSVVDKVSSGELTTTEGMLVLNTFNNQLKAARDGHPAYQLNPNEQAAFSGHQMFRDLAEAQGFAPQGNIFRPDSPVLKHLQDRGFA